MTQPPSRDVLARVRKLAQLPEEARHSRFAVSITRLTVLKSLCREPEVAARFVTYLARKALEHAMCGQRHSRSLPPQEDRAHREMMAEALAEMEGWPANPPEARRQRLWDLLRRMQAAQNEQKPIPWGAVRLIHDWELLVVEEAVRCVLNPREAGYWAYQAARDYTERYDPSHGSGLIPASAPL